MVFKEVGKFLAETGEKIIGRGPEVKFRNSVDKYAKDHSTSKEAAEKQIFNQYLTGLGLEANSGNIDYSSKQWRAFQAALNETCSSKTQAKFEKDANNPATFRNMPVAISPPEIKKMKGYFEKKFKGEAPNITILHEATENLKLLDSIRSRLGSDMAPILSANITLENLLTASPELSADIGKMLQAKKALEKHERMFDREIKFDKALDQLKIDVKESITTMLWSAPIKLLTDMTKGAYSVIKHGNLNGFFKAMGSSLTFLKDEVVAGSKLLKSGVKASALYLNTLRG